ncbi:MAG: serine hydrolase [Gammaproteobacteria bacterium]|nr:serine hydrolase [Gammaproteobacteria bacterium]
MRQIFSNCLLRYWFVILGLSPAANITAQEVELLTGEGILFWSPQQQITGYRGIDKLYPTREITAGQTAYPLIPDERDLSDFRYRYNGKRFTLDDYLRDMHVAGLIAVKDGRVVLERYGLGNNADSRWISFSVAKSVVSMLIGAAIKDGYFRSVDDLVTDYLPQLKGGAYDAVTVKNILQMASGVAWNEDYDDADSDVANAPGGTLPLFGYMRALSADAAPDEKFNYNTGETNIAGALLRAAIGNNLSTYLSSKIWQPFGMESDANWLIEEPGGVEFGGCCISATLRDYARIGIFAMRDGVLPDGERVLPKGWMAESTTPSNAYDGYGYYWWLFFGDGVYAALGVFGQLIYIDPDNNLVIAMHSAWPQAVGTEFGAHRGAFLQALARAL